MYATSIGTATDDLEWPFHVSRAISVVAELVAFLVLSISLNFR